MFAFCLTKMAGCSANSAGGCLYPYSGYQKTSKNTQKYQIKLVYVVRIIKEWYNIS
jgi:hypothetical protein